MKVYQLDGQWWLSLENPGFDFFDNNGKLKLKDFPAVTRQWVETYYQDGKVYKVVTYTTLRANKMDVTVRREMFNNSVVEYFDSFAKPTKAPVYGDAKTWDGEKWLDTEHPMRVEVVEVTAAGGVEEK